jgi:hypothetical protein
MGISADRLAASILRYTIECVTTTAATAQMTNTKTFKLRAYNSIDPRFAAPKVVGLSSLLPKFVAADSYLLVRRLRHRMRSNSGAQPAVLSVVDGGRAGPGRDLAHQTNPAI